MMSSDRNKSVDSLMRELRMIRCENSAMRIVIGITDRVRECQRIYMIDRSPENKTEVKNAVDAWDICRKELKI